MDVAVEECLHLLNQPITRRKIDWEKESFVVTEEEPIIPEQYSPEDVCFHNVLSEWNKPSVAFWRDKVTDSSNQSPPEIQSVEEHLLKQNRRYNFDINSSMILSHGEVVSVLSESGLGQYTRFYPMVLPAE